MYGEKYTMWCSFVRGKMFIKMVQVPTLRICFEPTVRTCVSRRVWWVT